MLRFTSDQIFLILKKAIARIIKKQMPNNHVYVISAGMSEIIGEASCR